MCKIEKNNIYIGESLFRTVLFSGSYVVVSTQVFLKKTI
jgi:hypothetical protein